MIELTEEQRRALQTSGEVPTRAVDPITQETYVLLPDVVFERVREAIRASAGSEPVSRIKGEMSESVRRARAAFLRDLPALLADPASARRWVAYHDGQRVGSGVSQRELIHACLTRGLREDEIYVDLVAARPPEPEAVDPSFFEFDESRPKQAAP